MTQADRIRRFALDQYIAPARAEGRREIVIRAGDIHREMGLSNAMPAVCSAIRSLRFGELAGVSLLETKGPANGPALPGGSLSNTGPTLPRGIPVEADPMSGAQMSSRGTANQLGGDDGEGPTETHRDVA